MLLEGVTGEPCRGKGESKLGLRRLERLNMPPRLLRPVVAVEDLPDSSEGVERRISSFNEVMVGDLPRDPSPVGGDRVGVDLVERAELVLCWRNIRLSRRGKRLRGSLSAAAAAAAEVASA